MFKVKEVQATLRVGVADVLELLVVSNKITFCHAFVAKKVQTET